MRKVYIYINFMIIIFLFSPTLYGAQVSKDEALSKFVEAGLAYKYGRYSEASHIYEKIIQSGWESGSLYYNLANSYFKQDLIGYALVNYERAKRIIPRDMDLKANFRFAMTFVDSPYKNPRRTIGQKLLEQHMDMFTLDELAILLYILGVLIGLFYLVSSSLKWSSQQKILLFYFLGILFLFYTFGFVFKYSSEINRGIITESTVSKFEPRDIATIHFELNAGEHIKIIKIEGVWVKIERYDGKIGWIRKEKMQNI